MAKRLVSSVGTKGIIYDTPAIYLPPSYWSDGRNVRFVDGKVSQMRGVTAAELDLANVAWVELFNNGVAKYYVYSDLDKIYAYDGSTEADITRASGGDYNSTLDSLFDLENFNGLGIINNGIDIPQLWAPTTVGTQLVNLTNWDTDDRAGTIVAFKNFLVALDVLKTADRFSNMVKWSHSAEPGAVPSSWDHTDPTLDAGEFSLSDTAYGSIINGRMLGNNLVIYKEGSIWLMSFVGGIKIFDVQPIPKKVGLRLRRSLCSLPPTRGMSETHFFADEDSFYIFNGVTPEPIFEQIFKKEIHALADPTYFSRSFSVLHKRENEVWFCIPELGSQVCTLAFVWNYRNDTYTMRELSGTLSIASGLSFFADVTAIFDLPHSDETLFDDEVGYFLENQLPSNWVTLEASYTLGELFYNDIGEFGYDGETYWSCYITRESLGIVAQDRNGEPEVDYNVRKLVTTIVPKLTGTVNCYVGVQETDRDAIAWSAAMTTTNEYKVDLPEPISGRLISFKYESIPGVTFTLGGFDYELDLLGSH